MKSRIGELIKILLVAKARGAKLTGKSQFEKELAELRGSPHVFSKDKNDIKKLDNSIYGNFI